MRIPHIFIDQPTGAGELIELPHDKAHHLRQVLRLKEQHPLTLFHGGIVWQGHIESLARQHCLIRIHEQVSQASTPPHPLTLVQGLCRQDKMDWIVQKATELGVERIAPVSCDHSTIKLNSQRQEAKQQHWQKIAINAAEQSKRSQVPTIEAIQPLQQWLRHDHQQIHIALHPQAAVHDWPQLSSNQSVALLIGPEGGFSQTEWQCMQTQLQTISLGSRILRSETAALAAITLCQYHYQGFND